LRYFLWPRVYQVCILFERSFLPCLLTSPFFFFSPSLLSLSNFTPLFPRWARLDDGEARFLRIAKDFPFCELPEPDLSSFFLSFPEHSRQASSQQSSFLTTPRNILDFKHWQNLLRRSHRSPPRTEAPGEAFASTLHFYISSLLVRPSLFSL